MTLLVVVIALYVALAFADRQLPNWIRPMK